MKTITKPTKTIEKELISSLNFPSSEILVNLDKQLIRSRNLKLACDYGNEVKHKVSIVFEDDESRKKVLTTIWEITDDYVVLKHNMVIPIHRIISVAW